MLLAAVEVLFTSLCLLPRDGEYLDALVGRAARAARCRGGAAPVAGAALGIGHGRDHLGRGVRDLELGHIQPPENETAATTPALGGVAAEGHSRCLVRRRPTRRDEGAAGRRRTSP